ncbi:MAG: sensor histidine kinase [Clostridia bacterium]|nr:sensor histidine kinase [Clostridia bacterium]
MESWLRLGVELLACTTEMLLMSFFACMLYEIRFKYRYVLLFSIVSGLGRTILEYFCFMMGDAMIMLRPLVTLLAAILFIKLFYKLDLKKAFVSTGLMAIILAFTNILVVATYYMVGIKQFDLNNLSQYVIGCILNNIYVLLILAFIKYFKFFSYFSKQMRTKALVSYVLYIAFFIIIILINMNYFYSPKHNKVEFDFVAFDILVFFFLLFNIVIIQKNLFANKALTEELHQKNSELLSANKKLKEYAESIEELAVVKERNRFARQIHDTLGHTMALLLAVLEVSSINLKKDPEKAEQKLLEATGMAREGLKELRRSISGLDNGKIEAENLIQSLKKLFADFESAGMNIDFTIQGIFDYKDPNYSDALYKTCLEALTNSLRHGKAKNVSIILKFFSDGMKLFIIDDGIGCKAIEKGFGLTGMEQRIQELKGKIHFGSDGENGFNIQIEIPTCT